jgi:hypothetical protein
MENMKTYLKILGIFLMASCTPSQQNHESSDTLSLEEWCNNVFSQAAEDTNTVIPNYVYATDWMGRYREYITEHFEGREDIWFSRDTAEGFDCRYWTMAYVDNDTIPEMLLYGGCQASGSIILTQFGCTVFASPKGRFSYIKGGDGLLHSQWKYGDNAFGEIYEIRNGKFTEIASYNLNSDLVDTSEVGNYGLTLDSLKCHYAGGEIGDSEVYISEIELNGKHLGACFGYNQYVSRAGFAQVKQTLDSLYYSKGTNTYFPNIFNTS